MIDELRSVPVIHFDCGCIRPYDYAGGDDAAAAEIADSHCYLHDGYPTVWAHLPAIELYP